MTPIIWPNFFIVGVGRAGTTSLYEYLRQVPGVYMSPVKEPRYFSGTDPFDRFAPEPIRSRKQYLRLFSGVKDESAVGEASPTYLTDPGAHARIHEVAPEARIIMSLRDPVEQIHSHYLLHTRAGLHRLSFDEAIKLDLYLKLPLYTEPVQRYLETFGAARVKILIFEEFVHDPRGAVRDVLRFLGVDAEPPAKIEVHNAYALPRGRWARLITRNGVVKRLGHALASERFRRRVREKFFVEKTSKPEMSRETRAYLEGFYRADVLKLEKILGRPLPWFHRTIP